LEFKFGLHASMFQLIDGTMGQQHRARAKRKRRRAYLQRKKASLRATRRERPKPKAMKQPLTVE
jgi:hypothetical protein